MHATSKVEPENCWANSPVLYSFALFTIVARVNGCMPRVVSSVLMELIRGKDHPSFKAISTNLKETKVAEPLGFI